MGSKQCFSLKTYLKGYFIYLLRLGCLLCKDYKKYEVVTCKFIYAISILKIYVSVKFISNCELIFVGGHHFHVLIFNPIAHSDQKWPDNFDEISQGKA